MRDRLSAPRGAAEADIHGRGVVTPPRLSAAVGSWRLRLHLIEVDGLGEEISSAEFVRTASSLIVFIGGYQHDR